MAKKMTKQAKVSFWAKRGSAVDNETYLVVYITCSCGKVIEGLRVLSDTAQTFEEEGRDSWIIKCPKRNCQRRYEVGEIAIKEL